MATVHFEAANASANVNDASPKALRNITSPESTSPFGEYDMQNYEETIGRFSNDLLKANLSTSRRQHVCHRLCPDS